MSGFVKELMNGVLKKFEIFGEFYKYDESDIDFKTRIDEYEIDDISYLHTLHDYWNDNYEYESPLFKYLERKKRLRVSRNGEGRKEMERILQERVEKDDDTKTSWDRMMGNP